MRGPPETSGRCHGRACLPLKRGGRPPKPWRRRADGDQICRQRMIPTPTLPFSRGGSTPSLGHRRTQFPCAQDGGRRPMPASAFCIQVESPNPPLIPAKAGIQFFFGKDWVPAEALVDAHISASSEESETAGLCSILPPPERGRSTREARREGLVGMGSAAIDPHPARCAHRPPPFRGRLHPWRRISTFDASSLVEMCASISATSGER